MTLDEAINHCEEVVKDYEKIKCIKAITLEELKYAEEYRQIAEWLKELKQLREQIHCRNKENAKGYAKGGIRNDRDNIKTI